MFIAPLTGVAQSPPARASRPAAKPKGAHAPGKKPNPPTSGLPTLNQTAPAFTLPDMEGHPYALAARRGRPVALFFFCGCDRCQRCAQTWGQLQRAGEIGTGRPGASDPAASGDLYGPNTVVVFMGDAESARGFAAATGLDTEQTVLLTDPRMAVTHTYHSLPCPRAFALDAAQTVRYVNSHKDDDPLTAASATIVTRTLEALTAAGQPKQGKGK